MLYSLISLFSTSAFAQDVAEATQAAPAAQPNPLTQFLPFVLIFVIFYFLMIRPQKKKMQEEQKLLNALEKGDEVYTKSGIIGTIVGLTDSVATLEISENSKMKILRGSIAGKADALFKKTEEKKN